MAKYYRNRDQYNGKHNECVGINIRSWTPEFKAEFKAWCAENGFTMEEVIEALIIEIMEDEDREIYKWISKARLRRKKRFEVDGFFRPD